MPKPTMKPPVQSAEAQTTEPPASPPPRQFATEGEKDAWIVDELVVASQLQTLLADAGVSADGVRVYIEQFAAKAAATGDPIERIVVEQLLFLHHRILRLHVEAAGEDSFEAVKAINGAAARLAGEFRRMVLALRTYRAPAVMKSATFVKLQAVAERQEVHYVDRTGPEKAQERIVFAQRNGVEDKPDTGAPDEAGSDRADEKSETRSRWQDQRFHAAAVD